jgi:hypothetical protein
MHVKQMRGAIRNNKTDRVRDNRIQGKRRRM